MSAPRHMTPTELLHALAVCLTEERMLASQVAVLTFVACTPGCTSGRIANVTGLSMPSVGRLLAYLLSTGDVDCRKEPARQWRNRGRKDAPVLRRCFWLTAQGADTVKRLTKHLGWDGCDAEVVKLRQLRPKNDFTFDDDHEQGIDGKAKGFLPGLF